MVIMVCRSVQSSLPCHQEDEAGEEGGGQEDLGEGEAGAVTSAGYDVPGGEVTLTRESQSLGMTTVVHLPVCH